MGKIKSSSLHRIVFMFSKRKFKTIIFAVGIVKVLLNKPKKIKTFWNFSG